jgi:hypothetical protein
VRLIELRGMRLEVAKQLLQQGHIVVRQPL